MSDLTDVRCRGCRRQIGVAPVDFRIYCDPWCAADFPAVTSEGRDALIEAIYQETGLNKTLISKSFGIARQRVDQIINRRNLKYEPPAKAS